MEFTVNETSGHRVHASKKTLFVYAALVLILVGLVYFILQIGEKEAPEDILRANRVDEPVVNRDEQRYILDVLRDNKTEAPIRNDAGRGEVEAILEQNTL